MKTLRNIATLTIAVCLLAGCGPQTRLSGDIDDYPLLTEKELGTGASFDAPQISPDGKLISYIAPHEGAPNFFVAPADDVEAARPVTTHTGRGVRATDVSGMVMYRWHYDSKHIIYPMDYDGDENWDIHVVDVKSGEDRNLTPTPEHGVGIIAYGRNNPDEVLASVSSLSTRQPDIYRLNLATGEQTLVLANDGAIAYLGDHDLALRGAIRFTEDLGLDFLKRNQDGSWSSIYEVGSEDLPAVSASSYQKIIRTDPTNRYLYLYDSIGRNTAALVTLDLETGDTKVIAEDPRVDIGGVMYHPVTSEVQGYATNWTRLSWHVIDDSIAADVEQLGRVADGDWTIVSRSDDDRKWIVRYMLSHTPITFYLFDRDTQSATRLFSSTPQLEGLMLSKLFPYELETPDGLPLVGYVALPPWTDPDEDGRPDKPVPMVTYVHGGPSDERAIFAFGGIVHSFANRGYAFLYVNFRGSAGFGKAFMNAQNMEWGGKMHDDVLQQVQWAIDEGIADPDRIAILGGSYGGYAALVGMTMTPEVFTCGVDIVGPSNLEIFMPHWDVDMMSKVIGDPRTEEGRAFLRSRSPINFAQQTKHPVLIGQGAHDSRVPQDQSDTMVARMVEVGAPVTYLVYPDEGHGFLRTENSRSFGSIMDVFLGECLGGRYEPITGQIEGSSLEVPVGAEHIPGLAEALAARTETGLPSHEVAEVDSAILAEYAGNYELAGYGVPVIVEVDGNQIFLQVTGQPQAEMFPTSETDFFFKVAPSTVSFFRGDDGGVSHLILYSGGSETRADRVN
jgi:dipeptidyl aminopeptidase/acylaminoacyl peptidase